jgi:GTP-binding protein HflX
LISLAGYTSAGKSTLFNVLAEETVPVDSNLFTTLSTTTRAIKLYGKKTLLTDTVGFIDRLPLTLINAFHSTLEETSYSDLIILVVDISEELKEIERKISCGLDTIKEIEAEGIPIITALNKIDLISNKEVELKTSALERLVPNPLPISALARMNIDLLKKRLSIYLTSKIEASLSLNLTNETMSIISWLYNETEVKNIEYKEAFVKATIRTDFSFAEKVRDRIEQHGGVFKTKTDQSLSILS